MDKLLGLVGGGSAINGAYPVSFPRVKKIHITIKNMIWANSVMI